MDETLNWLQDFYRRYEDHTRALFAIEPFWQTCGDCPDGGCCTSQTIPVMSPEWDNIVQHVRCNFSQRNKDRLLENIERGGHRCPYLFGQRCAIYPARPFACRLYPYSISFRDYQDDEIKYESGTFLLPYCKALAEGFGNKIGGEDIQVKPEIVGRKNESHLVKLKLAQPRDLWVIDRSDYNREYTEKMPKAEAGKLDGSDFNVWYQLPMYAYKKGKISEQKLREILGLD
jgi:Fe-S-cluster containining protein